MQKLHISEYVESTSELRELHERGEQLAKEIRVLNEKVGGIIMTPKHLRAARLEAWEAEVKEKTEEYHKTKKEFLEKAKTVKGRQDRPM